MGRPIVHGYTKHPLYPSWKQMIRRCENPKDKSYRLYGARGISVCKRWHKFPAFIKDMGERPAGKSLERRDNNKGYSPSNCYWATSEEQGRNTRTNRLVTFKGETLCMKDWSKRYGVHWATIDTRLEMGWPLGEALMTPAMNMSKPRLFIKRGGVARLVQEAA